MRKEYPNAFKRWQEAEDESLKNNWKSGKKVKDIAEVLGRHEGSVRARLKKHYGDDVFEV